MKPTERPPPHGRQLEIDFNRTRPAAPSSSIPAKSTRRYRPPDDPRWWASFICPNDAEFAEFMREDSGEGLA